MSEAAVLIDAHRYVYGKVVKVPGGPVEPGFEHRPTSITKGLPEEAIALCYPEDLLAQQSVQALIHPARRSEGAQFFLPATANDQHWMLATCVRARPEGGEDAASRTYTQLVTYVFSEADWSRYAPRLIANAPLWLRAEPDTEDGYAAFRSDPPPPVVLDTTLLPESPPCMTRPMPAADTLLWRLSSAFERHDAMLLCGSADGILTASMFLRAIACVAALLPPQLRIHMTVALGLAQPSKLFAVQYQPEAPPLPELRPGLLAQMASQLLCANPDSLARDLDVAWHVGNKIPAPSGALLQARKGVRMWRNATEARVSLASLIDHIAWSHSERDLLAWLEGNRPVCPGSPGPHQPEVAKGWVSTLAGHICDCLIEPGKPGIERALIRIASLIDPDIGPPNVLGDFWSKAWSEAEAQLAPCRIPGGLELRRPVLCWSAILGSDATDDHKAGIGYLLDFSELRAIRNATRQAAERAPGAAGAIAAALNTSAFKARVKDLRRRAARILVVRPDTIVDLAESLPDLLAPRPGEDRIHAEAAREVIEAIAYAARLHRHDKDKEIVGGNAEALLNAAETVLEAMRNPEQERERSQRPKPEAFELLLRCFWGQILEQSSGHLEPDTWWTDAVCIFIGLRSRECPDGKPLRRYFEGLPAAYCEHNGTKGASEVTANRIENFTNACINAATRDVDPPDVPLLLLRSLSDLTDLTDLASHPNERLPFPLRSTWKRRICDAITRMPGTASRLAETVLPEIVRLLDATVKRFSARDSTTGLPMENPRCEHLAAILDVETCLLKRIAGAPVPPPRIAVLNLIKLTNELTVRVSGYAREPRIPGLIEETAIALARCTARWSQLDPPEPWISEASCPLVNAPIYQALAKRLGFPMAAYFGGLTSPNYEAMENRPIQDLRGVEFSCTPAELLGLDPAEDTALDLVVAPGAARAWRKTFDAGPRGKDHMVRLLRAKATNVVLDALARVVRRRLPGYDQLIDAETRFVVGFFLSLGEDAKGPDLPPVGPSLERALLSNGGLHETCYGIQFAREVLRADAGWNYHMRLTQLFAGQDCPENLAKSVLRISSWESFSRLENAAAREAILRLLFLLALVTAQESPRRTPARVSVANKALLNTLRLAPGNPKVKIDMQRLLDVQKDLAIALRDAATRAHTSLPDWPVTDVG